MSEKIDDSLSTPATRKTFRNQFWSQKIGPEQNNDVAPGAKKEKAPESNGEDTSGKRPESVASRQFRPKKQQTTSETWIREQQNEPENNVRFPFETVIGSNHNDLSYEPLLKQITAFRYYIEPRYHEFTATALNVFVMYRYNLRLNPAVFRGKFVTPPQ